MNEMIPMDNATHLFICCVWLIVTLTPSQWQVRVFQSLQVFHQPQASAIMFSSWDGEELGHPSPRLPSRSTGIAGSAMHNHDTNTATHCTTSQTHHNPLSFNIHKTQHQPTQPTHHPTAASKHWTQRWRRSSARCTVGVTRDLASRN